MTTAELPVAHAPCAIVDPEFAALIPPLTDPERELLEASLVQVGCRDRLVVWQQGSILLDGHNRLEICIRRGIPFSTRAVDLKDRDAAKLWVLENQLGRRNLSDIDRIALAAQREPLIKAAAAKNQRRRSVVPQNSAEQTRPLETRKEAASVAGVSHDTYSKGKFILERGVPELVQAVRSDAASIHAAVEIAELPAAEQVAAVAAGKLTETANDLRRRRTRREQNTGNLEWYTPPDILDSARQVLGTIDLDPASSAIAQERVQAGRFFTSEEDGLRHPWSGRVWLNPPYARGLIGPFVGKLVEELAAGAVTAAILLANNETETQWFQSAAARADRICFPRGRIAFLRPDGTPAESGALQGQALFYFGTDAAAFERVCGRLGVVVAPSPTRACATATPTVGGQ